MPLLPGKKEIGHNIEEMQAAGHPHDQAVAAALDTARKHRADGGYTTTTSTPDSAMHVGPIHSSVAGRTDHLPITVPSGSYVLPADIVSAGGAGNTMAGFKVLKRVFGGEPYNQKDHYPYAQGSGPYGATIPKAHGGSTSGVPIVAAGGEHVLSPEQVRRVGNGDIDLGHRVLDAFVLKVRKELVQTLKHLAPPKKD
jgi:hypothetical protein